MSGKQRGSSRKSKLLDKLFGNKRRTILVALAVAVIGYLLFLIFGDIHVADDALYRPIVLGFLSFVGLLFVLGVQLINPHCTADAMDSGELFFALFSGIGLVIWMLGYGIKMLFSEEAYAAATMIAEVAGIWCAICLIHNARK